MKESHMAAKFVLLVLWLSEFHGLCTALKCHICDSVDGPGADYCTVVTSGVDSVEVTGNVSYTDSRCDKYCIKTEVTLGADFRDSPDFIQSVSRTCGSACIEYCYPLAKQSTLEVCVHCCETDLCNRASAMNFEPVAIFGGLFLLTLLGGYCVIAS